MVLQCINDVSSNSVEGRKQICQLKDLILTLFGLIFRRHIYVNCKTPNVVYPLDCHVCGSQYVGESVQPFNKRRNGHRSDLTKKTALARESTLCVARALIGRLWQIQNLYHWPQSKLERKSKTEKREFLDPRVTNITPGRHKQKGRNLLFFNFLTSAWSLASW